MVSAVTAPAAMLSISPSVNNVTVGQAFTLDFNIAGVTDLYSWEVYFDFGPIGLLSATGFTEGPFLGAGTTFGGSFNNPAATFYMYNSLSGASGVTGGGLLAQMSFLASAPGTSIVSFTSILMLDSNLDTIFPDTLSGATVNIGDVPEPSTFAFMALGLAVGAVIRRRI